MRSTDRSSAKEIQHCPQRLVKDVSKDGPRRKIALHKIPEKSLNLQNVGSTSTRNCVFIATRVRCWPAVNVSRLITGQQNTNYSEIADSVVISYRKEVEEICQMFEESREQFKAATNSVEHSRNRLRLMVTQACRDISAKEEEEIAKIRNKSRLLQDKVTQIGQERGAMDMIKY